MPMLLRLIPFVVSIFFFASNAHAGGTRIWEFAGFEELDMGVLDGTTLSDHGEVSVGLHASKLELDKEVGVVWTAIQDKNGDIYLGTGYDGKIYRKRGKNVQLVAETKQLVVTAFAFDKAGNLYAAALPNPTIWRIDHPGKASSVTTPKKWAELPEENEHIFALQFDRSRKTLFVGTGPEGNIFAIGKDKKPRMYLDTDQDHILSLALDNEGQLLAGTSPDARLLRITGPGRALALAEFDATEVKAVVVNKKETFVAVNEFKSPPKVPKKGTSTTPKTSSTTTGDGHIYSLDEKGRQSELWKEKKSHVVSLALSKANILYAGLGADGKVISIDDSKYIRTELDLKERQVMTLVCNQALTFVGMGDAGGIYEIAPSNLKEAVYLSPILEAETTSEFGRAEWLATGNLRVQSRSGNTTTPDTRWTPWSKPFKNGDKIPSPPGRYLQLRFSFAGAKEGVLVSAQVAFKPQNRKADIVEFDVGSPFPDPSTSDDNLSERTMDARPDFESDPEIAFKWKVKNPDGDTLRYRLWYRAVGTDLWRPILKEDTVLSRARYTWNTTSVPEGTYQIKLSADDSTQNDPRDVLEDTFISVPIIVDNNPPRITNLSINKGRIKGLAEDGYSKIGAVEMSIDNGPWIPITPEDGLYDEPREAFSLPLPKTGIRGPHAAAVRVYDRIGNMGISEIHFEEK